MKAQILGLLTVGLLAGPLAANATVIYSPTFTLAVGGTLPTAPTVAFPSPVLNISFGSTNLTFQFEGSELPTDDYSWAFNTFHFNLINHTRGLAQSQLCLGCGAFASGDLTFDAVSSVPEPGTLALLGLGLAGLGLSRRRKAD